jgi:hypothetical protein
MDKVMNHICLSLCTQKGYTSLFKASVFLISSYLIAMSQVGSFLYDKDISAHKAKFAIEATQNKSLKKIDCDVLQQTQRVECMVAKHEISTLDSSLGLLDSILYLIVVFGSLAGWYLINNRFLVRAV